MTDMLENGKRFRILTIIDHYTRECPALAVDYSFDTHRVIERLNEISAARGLPEVITVDNGSEFASRAMDAWAYRNGVKLDFIRPGKPVENAFIESFNGKLRDECLNVNVFADMADAGRKIESWRRDYNIWRPHSALGNLPPREFAKLKNGDVQKPENLYLKVV